MVIISKPHFSKEFESTSFVPSQFIGTEVMLQQILLYEREWQFSVIGSSRLIDEHALYQVDSMLPKTNVLRICFIWQMYLFFTVCKHLPINKLKT